MAENGLTFTFIWKIKDFSFKSQKYLLRSPSFFVQAMGGTAWNLDLNSYIDAYKYHVICYLRRSGVSGPDRLDFELSFLAGDGSVLKSLKLRKKVYEKTHFDLKHALCEKVDDVCLFKKDLFIPDDTLTIRCRMWDRQKSTAPSGRCFAETRIGTECQSSAGNIEKFSCLEQVRKYHIRIERSSREFYRFSMNLSVATNGLLNIEITPINYYSTCIYYRCKIFIQNIFGNKLKVGQDEFRDVKSHCIPLNISKDYVIKNKEYLLPNDELTICWELIIPGRHEIHELEYAFDYEDTQGGIFNTRSTDVSPEEHYIEPENGIDYEDTQDMISNVTKTNLDSERDHIEDLTTLKDDWVSLFREGILCDTKLKTATETFSAHIAVLSARSPIFKIMFTTDMKEKNNHCVNIDDLDADTVRRMLLFMYSATLHDLEYESAKNLYFAADKYNISSLRQRCSNFLKQNLQQLNCCDTLLLADKHQDKDLKNAVQDYIVKNDKVVLFSEEWMNLEKNHSQLTTEVFRFIYMKKMGH